VPSERTVALEERTSLWQPPGVAGLEVLHATFYHHAYPRHTHEHFVIGIVTVGVNPDEVHTGTAATALGYRYLALYPNAERLLALSEGVRNQVFFEAPVVHDPPMYRALLELHHTLSQACSALERDTALMSAIAALTARYGNATVVAGNDHPLAERVRERIRAELTADLSLTDLARTFDVTAHHLVRAFTRAFGLPPHAYQVQRRIDLARRLLRQSVPIAETADRSGFYDQSHLGRHFKRIVGVTPAQYALGTSIGSS
jgi:AraC-like DNA-binding protein